MSIRLAPLGAAHVADVEAMLGDHDLFRFDFKPGLREDTEIWSRLATDT